MLSQCVFTDRLSVDLKSFGQTIISSNKRLRVGTNTGHFVKSSIASL